LVLLGIPLAWVEWTIGRIAGEHGHGTAPGAFDVIVRRRWAKYVGIIGIMGPIIIMIYYTYIESWTLAYAFFSLFKRYGTATDQHLMKEFLLAYQGITKNQYFSSILPAFFFFTLTLLLNILIVYKGISKGIEKVCKIGMPVLLALGIFLVIRVLTLKSPVAELSEQNATSGLGFMWNPNFARLKDARVWLAASGQIFFTLSVGIGVILTYASYLKKTDDIPASALASASMNEFAEVILGGTIVIPAAFVFFGPTQIENIARSGAFNLGFVSIPLVFLKMSYGNILGFMWFFLLFIAGITSSISLLQPAISFFEDELGWHRKKAIVVIGLFLLLTTSLVIFFLPYGFLDEFDFWGGTFALVLFGTLEAILFGWVLGVEKGFDELHKGAIIRVPVFFKFVIKYITPLYLIGILVFWFYKEAIPFILLKG
ncbi:MAG: sodium:calcium symporter, partial [bacterium]